MNILRGIKSYIEENELKITIFNNKISILNYLDIGHFDSDKIIIKCDKKDVIVYGNSLVVSKLINDEVLITGEYKNIEFRWYHKKLLISFCQE